MPLFENIPIPMSVAHSVSFLFLSFFFLFSFPLSFTLFHYNHSYFLSIFDRASVPPISRKGTEFEIGAKIAYRRVCHCLGDFSSGTLRLLNVLRLLHTPQASKTLHRLLAVFVYGNTARSYGRSIGGGLGSSRAECFSLPLCCPSTLQALSPSLALGWVGIYTFCTTCPPSTDRLRLERKIDMTGFCVGLRLVHKLCL